MRIQDFKIPKITFSISSIINRQTVKLMAVCALTTLVVIGICSGIVWHKRADIFKYFVSEYARTLAANQTAVPSEDVAHTIATAVADVASKQVVATPASVETAVQKANPAVVAITISKTVPTYKTVYQDQDPFGGMFGTGFSFQIPTQVPTGTQKKKVGAGSGFLVSSDGLIVTNRHVVEDKDAEYSVTLTNGKEYTATVLARDAIMDIALIKITAGGLPYLHLGDSDSLKLGESVVAIGNALGQFQNTISVGVVSGLSRSLVAGNGGGTSEALDHVIQTDAAINPGNSGGPLLNLLGEVVGVNVAIVQGSQNIGFSLPINSIKSTIASVQTTGKIVRPYLGVRYVAITDNLKTKNNLSVDYGVLVQRGPTASDLAVIPGSPADKAGIVENDIILSVDGVKLDEDHNMASMIRQKKIGSKMILGVLSKGVQKTVVVVLEAAPQQ